LLVIRLHSSFISTSVRVPALEELSSYYNCITVSPTEIFRFNYYLFFFDMEESFFFKMVLELAEVILKDFIIFVSIGAGKSCVIQNKGSVTVVFAFII